MSDKRIEDVITKVLKGDAQKNALDFIAHIRASKDAEKYPIIMNDENDETGWNATNLGFIVITGTDDFPGPWTMWVNAENLGADAKQPVDEYVKETAWAHVSPCGNCGGDCSPGTHTVVFGKEFKNVCQHNLMFVNPNTETVDCMKKLIDIRMAG